MQLIAVAFESVQTFTDIDLQKRAFSWAGFDVHGGDCDSRT